MEGRAAAFPPVSVSDVHTKISLTVSPQYMPKARCRLAHPRPPGQPSSRAHSGRFVSLQHLAAAARLPAQHCHLPFLHLSWPQAGPQQKASPILPRAAAAGRFSLLPGTASSHCTTHSLPLVQSPARLGPLLQCPPTNTSTLMMGTSSPVIPQGRDRPKLTAGTGQDRSQNLADKSSSVSEEGQAPHCGWAGRDGPGPARGHLAHFKALWLQQGQKGRELSPGWQQLRQRGCAQLGGLGHALGGVSPQESSSGGRRGHMRIWLPPGSRPRW